MKFGLVKLENKTRTGTPKRERKKKKKQYIIFFSTFVVFVIIIFSNSFVNFNKYLVKWKYEWMFNGTTAQK